MSRLPASGRQHTRKQRLEEEDEPIELQLEEECPPTPMDRSLSNVVDEAAGTDAQVRELKGAAASKTMTRTQAQLNRSFQTSKMVRHLVVFAVLTFMHALALLVFKLCVVDHTYPCAVCTLQRSAAGSAPSCQAADIAPRVHYPSTASRPPLRSCAPRRPSC
jgi:hypothetical protein